MPDKIPYLPLFFAIVEKPCLVVGGGGVAARKVEQLLQAKALVTVIAPEVVRPLRKRIDQGECHWHERPYQSPEAQSYHLVIAAVNDPEVNQQVYADCQREGTPVNVVDQPELCSVIFPAIVRRGNLILALSSGGQTPFLTRYLRERLETFLQDVFFLDKPELLVSFRNFVKHRAKNTAQKEKLYSQFLEVGREQWLQWSAERPPYPLWEEWLKEIGE